MLFWAGLGTSGTLSPELIVTRKKQLRVCEGVRSEWVSPFLGDRWVGSEGVKTWDQHFLDACEGWEIL